MKVLFFAKNEWEKEYCTPLLQSVDCTFYVGTLHEHADHVDTSADTLCVFVNSAVSRKEMDRFPNLKLIATRSTGYDHIDIAAAKERNITVVTVPAYGENTVAEFAFALLLELARKVRLAATRVENGCNFSQEGLTGFDIKGKTIGIVGSGRIGAHAARIAKGFGMHVLVYDVYQNNDLAREIGFTYVNMQELLNTVDVISLHVPHTAATHHLINRGNVSSIKRGAYLINTARGPIVETAALVQALKEGIIAGAGLDVLECEGEMDATAVRTQEEISEETKAVIEGNHYLIDHPNVFVTPHIAFDTHEALERILTTTADNILGFQSGQPQNVLQLTA